MIKLVPDLFYQEKETKEALAAFIVGTDRLSIGPQCEAFERDFAHWQGRVYCTLFNSGSSANLALIQALINLKRIAAKDVVGFSAVTWATNVMPLIQLDLVPMPVDIEVETLNISSATLLRALDQHPEMKVLFITHLLGFCGDLDAVIALCQDRGITIIEDVCEALGSVYEGKKLGNVGVASTFSFFVGHHLSTIEGGAVCTDDPELDRMLRLVRAHGWDRNLGEADRRTIRQQYGIANDFFANFTFYELGYNLRPTEITGFLGQRQLVHADEIVSRRAQNFKEFQQGVLQNPDLMPLQVDHLDVISNFAMPIVCRTDELTALYIKAFQEAEVEIRPIVGGAIPDQPFFAKHPHVPISTPNATFVNNHGFYFGNHPNHTPADLAHLRRLLHQLPVATATPLAV